MGLKAPMVKAWRQVMPPKEQRTLPKGKKKIFRQGTLGGIFFYSPTYKYIE